MLANLIPPPLVPLFNSISLSVSRKFYKPYSLENLVPLFIFKWIRQFLNTTNCVFVSFANIALFGSLFVKKKNSFIAFNLLFVQMVLIEDAEAVVSTRIFPGSLQVRVIED